MSRKTITSYSFNEFPMKEELIALKVPKTVIRLFAKTAFVLLLWQVWPSSSAAQPTPSFLHPGRIRYNGWSLIIDGKPVFIYSGAFHYFRCPKPLWRERFQQMKDAGFNTVETYVPWNWSERRMPAGLDDFSKVNLKDFNDWLNMAEQFGFYIIVRPGPYICAEWDTGGFPQWLLTKKPKRWPQGESWLRSDDPVYLAWCKHWYDAVCPIIAKHQITRKPPGQPGVILVQIENEYDYAHFPDRVKVNQLKALAEDAHADGIDVPLITCWTRQVRGSSNPVLRQIFDCCNFYPRWNVDSILPDIEKLRRQQPDAPLATTELQGGWFSQVGGKLSEDQDGLTGSQINNLTLFAIQNGETILNYYMLVGGTNPGDWAARNVTTTYDYHAPIREWGGVGERYRRVWAIGHMLQRFGVRLARSRAVPCNVTSSQKQVTVFERRAPDGSRFLFVRTSQHTEACSGTATVKEESGGPLKFVFHYQLVPFGSKILYLPPGATNANQGQWLPKPAPPIARPTDLPSGVRITSAKMKTDPGPTHWIKLRAGETLARAGIYDSHFIFYRTRVACGTATNLLVEYPDGDAVVALVNGKRALRVGGTGQSSVFALPAGMDTVHLLYENHGHANGGSAMEHASGIREVRLTDSILAAGKPIEGWRMHLMKGIHNRPEVQPDLNDTHWTPVAADSVDANQLTPNETAVFRADMNFTKSDLNVAEMELRFGRIDDRGWVYVNGRRVGKATDWSHAYSFDVTKELHPGRNVVAVIVQNQNGGGGIGQPQLRAVSKDPPVPLEALGRPVGDEEQWWEPDLNDAAWRPVTFEPAPASSHSDSVLTWYRMNFSLPSLRPGVRVPWRLHLMASGNGFLYLNGHAMGRYWNVGPQHDFFLPGCWLHFGTGRTNNLTLNLRPVNGRAGIQSATVEPYAGFAEKE